jgi:hypothetical protein
MQIAVSLIDTSRPTECFMAVLSLLISEAGSPGARFHCQCKELPLLPSGSSALSVQGAIIGSLFEFADGNHAA